MYVFFLFCTMCGGHIWLLFGIYFLCVGHPMELFSGGFLPGAVTSLWYISGMRSYPMTLVSLRWSALFWQLRLTEVTEQRQSVSKRASLLHRNTRHNTYGLGSSSFMFDPILD